jgi:hypothetical protein
MVVYIYYITAAGYFTQLVAGQLQSGQPIQYGKGRRYGPSITYKITPAGSLSSSQPGGPPCWSSPLAFGHMDITREMENLGVTHRRATVDLALLYTGKEIEAQVLLFLYFLYPFYFAIFDTYVKCI